MKSVNWGHFEQRKRKDKESGKYYYERLLLGVVVGTDSAVRNDYIEHIEGLQPGDCVYVFSLGSKLNEKNILFAHRGADAVLYANSHSLSQARQREYIEFYANARGCEIQPVDWLPTVYTTTGGKIDSLESALEKAMNSNIEF